MVGNKENRLYETILFKHSKHMLKLMNTTIFTVKRSKELSYLDKGYVCLRESDLMLTLHCGGLQLDNWV